MTNFVSAASTPSHSVVLVAADVGEHFPKLLELSTSPEDCSRSACPIIPIGPYCSC